MNQEVFCDIFLILFYVLIFLFFFMLLSSFVEGGGERIGGIVQSYALLYRIQLFWCGLYGFN